MARNKTSIVLGLNLAALVLLALPSPALAFHPWLNYHWAREENPFKVQVGNNLSAVWLPYLTEAVSDWSQSEVLDFQIVPGRSQSPDCPPTMGRIEICNAHYGPTGWAGLTRVLTVDDDHVLYAIIQLHDTILNTNIYPEEKRLSLVCHELGHGGLLGHQDDDFRNPPLGSCMDIVHMDYIAQSMHPNQADYDTLDSIYEHLDDFTTIINDFAPIRIGNGGASGDGGARDAGSDAEAEAAARAVTMDPKTWGEPIEFDEAGRAVTFEYNLGSRSGYKVTTHVEWLPQSPAPKRVAR